MSKQIYPVIHLEDVPLALDQADIAFECGADGVFVISHNGDDEEAAEVARKIKAKYKDKQIGVNLLSTNPANAVRMAEGLNMIWFDSCGIVNGDHETQSPLVIQRMGEVFDLKVFGGIAFKYKQHDFKAAASALCAHEIGLIPTTSGAGTGFAPDLQKIIDMSKAVNGNLAIASGMTPDNIEEFAPYLQYILVATGVSIDAYHFDYEKLRTFIGKVRNL